MNVTIIVMIVVFATVMCVYAALGTGVTQEYTISYITPYCYLVDGENVNIAIKKINRTQQQQTSTNYTTTDSTVQHIVFDYWDDTVYGTNLSLNWDSGSSTSVDANGNGNIRVFYQSTSKTIYVLSQSLIAARNCSRMFYNFTALLDVTFANFNSVTATSHENMFYGCTKMKTINDSENISTNLSTSLEGMFYNCNVLNGLDVSVFRTGNVKTMKNMFYGCSALTSLDVSKFEVDMVSDFSQMFYGCTKLGNLDLSNFKTSAATNMSNMFYGCSTMTTIAPTQFYTPAVTDMSGMFYGCTALTSLDLTSFATPAVTNMTEMFYNTSSLTALDLKTMTCDSVTNMTRMFAKCGTETLNLSFFDTKNVTDMTEMFNGMTNLTTIWVSNLWTTQFVTSSSAMFTNSTHVVGGNGTVYSTSHIDKEYAHVDLANEKGYLTAADVQYRGVYILDEEGGVLNITYVGTETPFTLPTGTEYDYFKLSSGTQYQPGATISWGSLSGSGDVKFTLYIKKYKVTFSNGNNNGSYVNRTVTYVLNGETKTVTSGNSIPSGVTVTISVSSSNTTYINPTVESVKTASNKTVTVTTVSNNKTYTFVMPSEAVTVTFSSTRNGGGGCVASGTKVTLADGSIKLVEDLTLDDKILIFNHETGKFDVGDMNFIEYDGDKYYDVVTLKFSDGTETHIIDEHGFFDADINEYVYITAENCKSFVGDRFYKYVDNDGIYSLETVVLESAEITTEWTGCYSFVTVYHLDYFVDSMLSMPGGIWGLFNIFEYDENLKYDEVDKTQALTEYGICEYEMLKDIVSKESYDLYPAKYFLVSIARGLMTMEDIEYYAWRYC